MIVLPILKSAKGVSFLVLWAAVLGVTASLAAAEKEAVTEDQPEGTIAFSSLAPRGYDLYLKGPDGADSRLTEHRALDMNAVVSPDGLRIAFVSERDGNMELYLMKLDGSGEIRRLTRNFALDDHPSWSPDGRRIAFVSTRQAASAGRAWNAVYVMDADASNVRRVSPADVTDYSPAWSPSGDLIAVASGSGESGKSDIYVMAPNGKNRRLLVKNGGWPAFIEQGRAIAFHSKRDGDHWGVWRIGVDGSGLKRLVSGASMPRATLGGEKLAVVLHGDHQQIAVFHLETEKLEAITSGETDHWNPTISPNGKTVVYHRKSPETKTPHVEVWGAPTGTRLNMLRLAGAFPAFSPDDRQVALTGHGFGRIDVMNLDGSKRKTIFEGEHRSLFGVSWSAEPDRVAFSHGVVFGKANIKVNIKAATPQGKDLIQLTADAGNNGFPSYSPDGKQIVFRSGRDGSKNLYLMDRSGQNVRRLTEGDWTDTMCDWSPTGQWIAFASNRENNFEIWLIRPEGGGLRKLIGGGGRHNHPHFSPDGKWIVFTSQRAGFSAEEVSLPHQPQPYGDLFVIRIDGGGLLRLTHNGLEEGTPVWSAVTKITPSEEGGVEEREY